MGKPIDESKRIRARRRTRAQIEEQFVESLREKHPLTRARELRRLTREQLCRKARISVNTLRKAERGQRIQRGRMCWILNALGIPFSSGLYVFPQGEVRR